MMREERDSLGVVQVPKDVYYGAQTMRAANNFHITGKHVHPLMFVALANVKKACALALKEIKELDDDVADAIIQACDEILGGQYKDAFITDAIQGGAGTSMNMNINEILANRAEQILGGNLGEYRRVHPNDHVNKAQSTNDVIPTAGRLTTLLLSQELLEQLDKLADAFGIKAKAFDKIIKVGRTHLQDAVLISMGQVFASYETVMRRDIKRLNNALEEMHAVNLGATAVGTGINSVSGYAERAVDYLAKVTDMDFELAGDLIDATKHVDSFAYVHASLKNLAISLSRICNDLRMMASGPKVGFNEINLPSKQPGSSIMPGKVNPVIPEVVNQVCFEVIGNDVTITMAAEAGQMELNVFEPVLFYNLFESLEILTNACETLRVHAIEGITVNEKRVHDYVENSLAMATALVKKLGYSQVSSLTKQALEENKSMRSIVLEQGLLTQQEVDDILKPEAMLHPR